MSGPLAWAWKSFRASETALCGQAYRELSNQWLLQAVALVSGSAAAAMQI